ncbi:MAG: bile acid:sodium symporter family protein [Coriobacteriia bacterium]|nr:bile acid:sodium symporter family protein [Coriobacteriia bacterium]
METVGKVSTFLTRNIAVFIILFSVVAFFVPGLFAWCTSYTTIFLAVAMFGMGLTISFKDFGVVFSHPKEVVLGCVLQYTVMPCAAWLIATALQLDADLALGVILVGCCPGGTASNVIAYIAKGDVPLSVGMTIVSTLLAPLVTPLLVFALAGAWVEVSIWAMMQTVVQVVLIPVALGIAINAFAGNVIRRVEPVLPLVSVAAIVMIVAGIVAVNNQKIVQCGVLVLVAVMLHNACGMGLGYLVARLFKLDYAKTTSVAIEVGMQNSGLSVSLATANFAANPLATLPGAIFSVWHNIAGSLFASWRARNCDK